MKTSGITHPDPTTADLRKLVLLGTFEAATLIALICVAVPLKYLFGQPAMVKLMGPIHGLAFLIYLWSLFHHAIAGTIGRKIALILAASAFIPFGFFASRNCLGRPAILPELRP